MLTFEGAQTQGTQAIVEKLVVRIILGNFLTLEPSLPEGPAQGRHP